MANLLDYLDWRGDLTLAQDPFNEVDNLVLSQLSYLDLAGVVPAPGEGRPVSVTAAARRFAELHGDGGAPGGIVSPLTPQVLEKMAAGRRFGAARLSRYEAVTTDDEQFAAVCVRLDDRTTYVAFRGTDVTFSGWREDFAMSFSTVPAQEHARAYLESARRATRGPLRVGGHSKGGNLAIWAAACSGWAARRRIIEVWNNDGPGFCEGALDERRYGAIAARTRRLVPEFCVVGRLLEQPGPYEVVASDGVGVMQHSAMSWQVLGNRFVRRDGVSDASDRLARTFDDLITGHDAAWRKRLTDAVFDSLAAGGSTMDELAAGMPGSLMRVAKAYLGVETELQQAVQTIVTAFVSESLSQQLAEAGPLGGAIASLLSGRREDAEGTTGGRGAR